MHELHLLQQVVEQVEQQCLTRPGAQLSRIHLEIDSHSHLASHTCKELQATFEFAAQGSIVDSADLDIHIHTSRGTCSSCQKIFEHTPEIFGCPQCFSGDIAWEHHPELIIRGLEFLERSP